MEWALNPTKKWLLIPITFVPLQCGIQSRSQVYLILLSSPSLNSFLSKLAGPTASFYFLWTHGRKGFPTHTTQDRRQEGALWLICLLLPVHAFPFIQRMLSHFLSGLPLKKKCMELKMCCFARKGIARKADLCYINICFWISVRERLLTGARWSAALALVGWVGDLVSDTTSSYSFEY